MKSILTTGWFTEALTGAVDVDQWQDEVVIHVPALRVLAMLLCDDLPAADELVQETLSEAWPSRRTSRSTKELKLSLFRVMLQTWRDIRSEHRAHSLFQAEPLEPTLISDPDGRPNQELGTLLSALRQLPRDDRVTLVLVGAGGLSCDQAASIVGVPVRTVERRVRWGRQRLLQLISSSQDRGTTIH